MVVHKNLYIVAGNDVISYFQSTTSSVDATGASATLTILWDTRSTLWKLVSIIVSMIKTANMFILITETVKRLSSVTLKLKLPCQEKTLNNAYTHA